MQHTESSFKGLKDFKIYYQSWMPDKSPKAILMVSHGFGEHSGRYGNLVKQLVPAGYAIYALDHRGHGLLPSTGISGPIFREARVWLGSRRPEPGHLRIRRSKSKYLR